MVTPALFFHALPALLANLPDQPLATPTHAATTNHTDIHTLIHSYLNHYKINFITRLPCTHYMWQSTLSSPQTQDPQASHSPETSTAAQTTAHSPTQYRIVQQYWQAENSRGTWVLAHGYFDHVGLYGRIIQWALTHHYSVLCFDLPGHGLSGGKPAAIDDFDRYKDIFNTVIERSINTQLITGPLYAIGQSTGCSVITQSLINNPVANYQFEHVILLAPLVRIRHWPLLRWLYFVLSPLIHSIKRAFVPSSHDTVFNYFLRYNDPLQTQRIPMCWLGAMESWYQRIKQHPTSTHYSQALTIIQGTSDTTVDWRYNTKKLQQLFPNTQIHYVKKARHHLVKESDEYWRPVENIIETILTPPQPHN